MPEGMKPTGVRAVAIRALRIVEQLTSRVTKVVRAVRTDLERAAPEERPERPKRAAAKQPRRAATRKAA
jgi:hypothetical protein